MKKINKWKIGVLVVLGMFVAMALTTGVSAIDPNDWTIGGNNLGGGGSGNLGTTSNDDLAFITNNAQRMIIKAGGDIGIGIATPSHKLEISDSSTTANRAGLYVAQTGAMSGTGYGAYTTKTGASTTNVAGYFSASGATNNYGLIIENGYVGIGTISPECHFDIESNDTLGTKIELQNTDTGGDRWQIISKGSSNPGVSGDLMFYDVTSSTAGPVFTWDGKVGIGTAVPGALLEIATTTGDPFLGFDINGTDKFMIGVDDSDGDKLKIGTTLIDTDTRLTIDSSGNIGIGTISPDRLFHTEVSDAGTNSVTYAQRLSHITSGTATTSFGTGIEFELEDGGGGNDVAAAIEAVWSSATGGSEESSLQFKTTDVGDDGLATRVLIDKDGNVGIGTTTPKGALNIDNTGESNGFGVYYDTYFLQTDDATETAIATISTESNKVYGIKVSVVGINTEDTEAAHYVRTQSYRNFGGSLNTILGISGYSLVAEDDTNWNARITNSGTNILVYVTGDGGPEVVNWQATVELNVLGYS